MRPINQTRWSWRKLAAPFAASILLLSGCAAADTSGTTDTAPVATAEQVEISFLTHWGPDQVALLEAAATKFKEVNPNVTVSIQAVPFGNLLDTVRTQASTPDGPTISGLYDAWLPELVRDGLAAPAPAEYADDINSAYPAPLAQDVTKEGNVYGYPSEVTLYALNYNARLFEEAGIDGPPPRPMKKCLLPQRRLTLSVVTSKALGSLRAGLPEPFTPSCHWLRQTA